MTLLAPACSAGMIEFPKAALEDVEEALKQRSLRTHEPWQSFPDELYEALRAKGVDYGQRAMREARVGGGAGSSRQGAGAVETYKSPEFGDEYLPEPLRPGEGFEGGNWLEHLEGHSRGGRKD
ncbi:uncharacterized protein PFL1_01505 [Pseudozyma flocculosa PF-1]|uniref:uncharacterized protein n=1 Tax=Pseudozyma flocculosa PF-1 TaxID=1277687 RepID=UPI0004561651|nr:uncharacterized protein PFL1_01505 [Pseudozyma flocculosa PF-1]EPQ31321.1 hypothetical protein PFL1_01505 [Pseudozyma flocculosa PF-1]